MSSPPRVAAVTAILYPVSRIPLGPASETDVHYVAVIPGIRTDG